MNPLDTLIQSTAPMVMVPRYEALPLLNEDGHRYLAAEDGVHTEIRRPWVHVITKNEPGVSPFPYGPAPQLFNLNLDADALASGLRRFINEARAIYPLEHAAWLIFDADSGSLDYEVPVVIAQNGAHIQYERPQPTSHRLPVVDMHSHGTHPAFFSADDQADDLVDDLKLAFVVGELHCHLPSIALRLVGLRHSVDISDFASSILHNVRISRIFDGDLDEH